MTAFTVTQFVFGFVGCAAVLGTLTLLFRALTLAVEDETALLVLRFGSLSRTLKEPGLHFCWDRSLPWCKVIPVSLQKDFRHFREIHVNDSRGTTLLIDLWLEFRIRDAEKAMFRIEDWEKSLRSLVTHATTSLLSAREFESILKDRMDLGKALQAELARETARWGIEIELASIRKIGLLPEISRQIFERVAARLEMAKARVEEEGRLRVALLEAETASQVALLEAQAKGEHPLAIGRAFEDLGCHPEVLAAYEELHQLGLVRPHRTVSFEGFEAEEMRAIDASMTSQEFFAPKRLDISDSPDRDTESPRSSTSATSAE